MPTARTKNPSLVAEERAQAEALFDSIGDGAIATDEFGKITRINSRALNILDFKESEIMGMWFPQKIIAADMNGVPVSLIDRPITKAFLTGLPVSEKMQYHRKNGTMVPVSVTVSPIIFNNRPIGAIEVFRDITLEYEIDRMKSDFISLASHQLRTPLSAIKTYAHMLLEGYMGKLEPAQRRSLQTIIVASNRMNELISTLLNITRIESGSVTVAVKPTNLRKLCEDSLEDLRHTAVAKEINLQVKTVSKSSMVRTDGLIVKEIINNLISNAIKYTPNGGTVIITIRPRKTSVVISVADSGFGIPKYAHDQIFTKFFRAENVVRRETTGTGLGLYLVRGLAEQLGGKIWFESEENKGSTFYLSLPMRLDSLSSKSQPPSVTK